jgi:hypothetical protein
MNTQTELKEYKRWCLENKHYEEWMMYHAELRILISTIRKEKIKRIWKERF